MNFTVSSKPTIIKYTGGLADQDINVEIDNIYSAMAAYIEPINYISSYSFGIYNDVDNSTSIDFSYYNVLNTEDSKTKHNFDITFKTGKNLYPSDSDEIPSDLTNYTPHTYSWHKIQITTLLLNDGKHVKTHTEYTPVIEVRQRQNSISLPSSYTAIINPGNTSQKFQIGPLKIYPSNAYIKHVIAYDPLVGMSSDLLIDIENGQLLNNEYLYFTHKGKTGEAKITVQHGDTRNFAQTIKVSLCTQSPTTTPTPKPTTTPTPTTP